MKELPIEFEIKEFIKSKIQEGLENPEKMAENIFTNLKNHWIFGKRSFLPWVESPDVNPFVKGHLLVIPKNHVEFIWDIPNV